VEWDQDCGQNIRYSDLADYLVVFLHALRDVATDLKTSRNSPLRRLLRSLDLPDAEQSRLVEVLKQANEAIADTDTIKQIGTMLHERFHGTAGEAFALDLKLGMSTPSFSAIEKSLTVLLSGTAHSGFEPSQNGLGINNVLYLAILLQYFQSRRDSARSAGSLLLIEEPEAHLHAQLQRVLFDTLKVHGVQTFVTTHSTHITSAGDIDSFLVLTVLPDGSIHGHVPAANPHLTTADKADLNRYLDATKSTLLFARKVILVEGPAELFLIPPLTKRLRDIELDRRGIAVIPIFGTHFGPFAKLFGPDGIRKRCAIVTDRDGVEPEEDGAPPRDLGQFQDDYVKVFASVQTLEAELAIPGLLAPLRAVAVELGGRELRNAIDEDPANMPAVAERTLALAKRVSKGRFAQVLSRHLSDAAAMPQYLQDAIAWITE